MENISSRVPAGESYLVLFDYKAVEEDEIESPQEEEYDPEHSEYDPEQVGYLRAPERADRERQSSQRISDDGDDFIIIKQDWKPTSL